MPEKVALIAGANGITGAAILEHLVKNTTADEWRKLVITSRSPLQLTIHDPRITFIPLDFTKKPQELILAMRDVCSDVTHAYFSAYVHRDDFQELNVANQQLFENFLGALIEVAPGLQNCTLQTGGKYYSVHEMPVPSPAREDAPRRSKANFYYQQEDFLVEKQRGSSWTWNVIRPEAIIGATPKANGMNSALTLAIYFLVCRELGAEAMMPTNQLYWAGYDDSSSAELIADLTVFVSVNPKCANQAFNAANGDYFSWRYMWPRLAQYFGAYASSDQAFDKPAPKEGDVQQEFSLQEWSRDKRGVWDSLCERSGNLQAKATFDAGTFAFQDWVFQRTWSATLSINKARAFGWTGHIDSFDNYVQAFERFREWGQIP